MSLLVSPDPAPFLTRSALLAAGVSDSTIRRALASGRLTTVLPGVYAPVEHPVPQDPGAVHRAIVYALLPRMARGSVASHQSAAAVHGLAVPQGDPVLHVTRPPPSKSHRGAMVCLHRGHLEPAEVVTVDCLPVTSPARTVLDCAMTLDAGDAVRLARSAVDAGLLDSAQLAAQLRRRSRAPGIRVAAARLAGVTGPL